jgi:hypothetical protein
MDHRGILLTALMKTGESAKGVDGILCKVKGLRHVAVQSPPFICFLPCDSEFG